MRLKIKLVIGITLVFIFLGLGYIIVNTTIRYQQEFGRVAYNCNENEESEKEKFNCS